MVLLGTMIYQGLQPMVRLPLQLVMSILVISNRSIGLSIATTIVVPH